VSILAATVEDACGTDPSTLCEFFFNVTKSEAVASLADVARTPIAIVIILLVAWLFNRYVRRAIDGFVDRVVRRHEGEAITVGSARSEQRARTLGQVLRNGASIVIYTIAIVVALGEFEINLGPLIASAGIVGVALGFGAQSLVKDFLSGIFMLIEDQYGVGDVIDVGEAAGVVEAVNLRTTELRDVYGTLWHVPNGEIRRVANKSQTWARTVLDIDVAYDTDIDHAMRVIKEVADGVWHEGFENATILEEPEVWGVEAFRADSVAIRLAVKVEPAEQWTTARIIRGRLKAAFDREGIQIPFPQRTVWMRTVEDGDPPPQRPDPTQSDATEFTPSPSPKGELGT
jgi:small-conductance mechanosensitive channel